MGKHIYAVAAILLATLIFLTGNGLLGTVTPVRAHLEGFSDLAIGFMGSAYYAGFFIGCFVGPRLLLRLSDRMDRRIVIAAVALLAAAAGVSLGYFGGTNVARTLILVTVFGMTALPCYGLAVAHTNDRLPRDAFVEASASLLLVNSLASVAGPILAALVTARAGTQALFYYTAVIHTGFALYTLYRIRKMEPAPDEYRDTFSPMPQQASPVALELDPRSPETEEAV